MQTKKEVRSKLRQQSRQFPPNFFIMEDRASVISLLQSPSYKKCTTLFAFSPLAVEVDISTVLEEAIKHKKLALPRCMGETLEFQMVGEEWKNEAIPSSLGVMEPRPGVRAIPTPDCLILVPAMAYTPEGVRLGRGKGYYDRYLREYPTVPTMGICRSYQLQKTLPSERWDMRVKEVLCNGIIYRT